MALSMPLYPLSRPHQLLCFITSCIALCAHRMEGIFSRPFSSELCFPLPLQPDEPNVSKARCWKGPPGVVRARNTPCSSFWSLGNRPVDGEGHMDPLIHSNHFASPRLHLHLSLVHLNAVRTSISTSTCPHIVR
ncbi:hypothetical protein LZ30DRAFT_353586 [Colletotrichum cereale]|nr:hypothetical protein LZ30DRAFT_353586 [Colletotrichum cereale]